MFREDRGEASAPAGSETDIVTALAKPVGVLVSGANLAFSDQGKGSILTAPIASPTSVSVLVSAIPGPDLLCAGPNGTYFMGGTTGEIRRIDASGRYTILAGGFLPIRGIAYDAKNRRIFAAEHDPAGVKSALRVLRVD
jgi:hypothetical protein